MTSYLVYWKVFWNDVARGHDVTRFEWGTSRKNFLFNVKPGDVIWVVIYDDKSSIHGWKLLKKIVVDKMHEDKESAYPYRAYGNDELSKFYNIENQADIESILKQLKFKSNKPIHKAKKEIGQTLQAIRPLADKDTILLEKQFGGTEDIEPQAYKTEQELKRGACFGDSKENKKVEIAAVDFVKYNFESNGWVVESVEQLKIGYDLICTKGKVVEHVEVKGIKGEIANFIITANELNTAKNNPIFKICIVTNALSKDIAMVEYSGKDLIAKYTFKPLAYSACIK